IHQDPGHADRNPICDSYAWPDVYAKAADGHLARPIPYAHRWSDPDRRRRRRLSLRIKQKEGRLSQPPFSLLADDPRSLQLRFDHAARIAHRQLDVRVSEPASCQTE